MHVSRTRKVLRSAVIAGNKNTKTCRAARKQHPDNLDLQCDLRFLNAQLLNQEPFQDIKGHKNALFRVCM